MTRATRRKATSFATSSQRGKGESQQQLTASANSWVCIWPTTRPTRDSGFGGFDLGNRQRTRDLPCSARIRIAAPHTLKRCAGGHWCTTKTQNKKEKKQGGLRSKTPPGIFYAPTSPSRGGGRRSCSDCSSRPRSCTVYCRSRSKTPCSSPAVRWQSKQTTDV